MHAVPFGTCCWWQAGTENRKENVSVAGGYWAQHGADSWSVLRYRPHACAIVTASCCTWGCLFTPGHFAPVAPSSMAQIANLRAACSRLPARGDGTGIAPRLTIFLMYWPMPETTCCFACQLQALKPLKSGFWRWKCQKEGKCLQKHAERWNLGTVSRTGQLCMRLLMPHLSYLTGTWWMSVNELDRLNYSGLKVAFLRADIAVCEQEYV